MKDKKSLIAQISQHVAPVTSEAIPEAIEVEKIKPTSRTLPLSRKPTLKSSPPVTETSTSPTGTGKQAAFWLDDEDRAIFHEVGMLLYTQGIKPSHNLVLRAAIRMLPRDHRLVESVRDLIEKDGRKVRHKKTSR